MIIWIFDRFGLPGRYHSVWLGLLKSNGIDPSRVRAVQLSRIIPGQLLQRYASRKAPTWIPERQNEIKLAVSALIEASGAKAVVLAAPESLAVLDMHPDHATLHNLRGSVYWRNGIPHIVMLPMSAWHSLVSQKEIGLANYGFESQTDMAANIVTVDVESSQLAITDRGRTRQAVDADLPSQHGGLIHSSEDRAERGESFDGDGSGGGPEDDSVDDIGTGQESAEIDAVGSDSGNVRSDHGAVLPGDPESQPDRDTIEDDDRDSKDRFFYEPVLSPVGRFVLTVDTAKLSRIMKHGSGSNGPEKPTVLRYR